MQTEKIKVVLVDKRGKEVGLLGKEKAHQIPTKLHKAISVLIFDQKGNILLQKRSQKKKTWPGYWSNSCCSHPFFEEDSLKAAKRRLKEELGIGKILLKELFSFKYQAEFDKVWGENEDDTVFRGVYSGKITPNKDEVEDIKWISLNDLKKDVIQNPEIYTPWLKIILEKI